MYDLFSGEADPIVFAPRARTSLIPRDYQQSAIEESFRLWNEGHVGVMCRIPTGGGKTFTGTSIADLWNQQGDNYRTLVMCHERQLIDQFAQDIEDILHVRPAIEMGEIHCKGNEPLIVASRQTLYVKRDINGEQSRLFKFRPDLNWLLIIDEAHRYTRHLKIVKPIIEWFEQNANHRRLLLTATPERTDKISFEGLATGISSDYMLYDVDGGPSAVNDGWAVPYDQRYIVVDGVNFDSIPTDKGDFDPNELERILSEQSPLAAVCDPLLDIVGKRRTLIFSPTKAMAKAVALYINAKLELTAAKSLDGDQPDYVRKSVFREHQSGAFQFLSICMLCREGYNDPDIAAVAIFRITKSRSLKEQMCGRGCRPKRGTVSSEMTRDERRKAILQSDKPTCLIVDLTGATGLGDVPSTVDILAASKPDDVRALANKKIQAKKPDERGDVQQAIKDAENEIAEDRRLAREAKLKREQDEADRRAKLKAKVSYTEHKVSSGQAGKSHRQQKHTNPPSVGMCKYLYALGVNNPESMSMNQAKGFLNQVGKKHGQEYIVRGGEHRGKALKDIPHPELRVLAQKRNSGSDYDREFQSQVALYRRQWLAAQQQKDESGFD